jgi:hypothetical protein
MRLHAEWQPRDGGDNWLHRASQGSPRRWPGKLIIPNLESRVP